MAIYNTFIIDDEPDAGNLLKSLLQAYPSIHVTKVFNSASEALDAIIMEQPPVVFCDIEMPELSGMELLERVNKCAPQCKVIFVTGYKDYAIDAIRNSAFDYICKPVNRKDLQEVVHKLMATKAVQMPISKEESQRILIKTIEGHHYVANNEVLYLEADSNYTYLVMQNGNKILSSINLGKVHEMFPKGKFVRISRKHIINKSYLSFMNFCKRYCIVSHLGNEYRLEVSVKMKDLKQELNK